MHFAFTEEQETVAKVARELFDHHATPERLTEIEATGVRHDADLWRELSGADLLGIGLPESVGGSGGGFLEVATLLVEAGRAAAPVPLWATLVLGADTIAREGDDAQKDRHLSAVSAGQTVLTAALTEPGVSDPRRPATTARQDGTSWRLDGSKDLVPAGQLADTVIVSAVDEHGPALFLVDSHSAGVRFTPAETTDGEPVADLDLTGAPAQRLGGSGAEAVSALYTRALVGLCALQLGVTEKALELAATYTAQREQFGRPIGSFQAVQQRMADAFIDVEAIRWTMWHAAWLVDRHRAADREAAIAKFWAAEAGSRVVATAQQVHGGMGIDVTYPLSRYFLWAKQIELTLGSATQQLVRLGQTYPEGVR